MRRGGGGGDGAPGGVRGFLGGNPGLPREGGERDRAVWGTQVREGAAVRQGPRQARRIVHPGHAAGATPPPGRHAR